MLRYTTDRARHGLVALYDIWPGNGAGPFLQPRSPHGAKQSLLGRPFMAQVVLEKGRTLLMFLSRLVIVGTV